jgi:hypothetical protein
VAISLPVPNDVDKPRPLAQLLKEILRRALDVSINPAIMNVGLKVTGNDITISTAGNGLVLSNRSGTHTYRLLIEDNGAISADQIT